jgi:hypothetical protein
VGQFHYVIRKRIQLAPEKALFLFCSNTIPPNGECAGDGNLAVYAFLICSQ